MRRSLGQKCRTRRGAAMVEALVVIPFFIIAFAGAMFAGSLYNNKLRGIAESRQKAWKAAEVGCDGDAAGLTIIESGDLKQMSKSPLAALCDKGFGSASYTSTSSVTANGVLGFGTKEVSSTATVTCDEIPRKGDFKGAVDFLWEFFDMPEVNPPTPLELPWY